MVEISFLIVLDNEKCKPVSFVSVFFFIILSQHFTMATKKRISFKNVQYSNKNCSFFLKVEIKLFFLLLCLLPFYKGKYGKS